MAVRIGGREDPVEVDGSAAGISLAVVQSAVHRTSKARLLVR